MVEMQVEQMYYDYQMRLQQQGIPMDQYLQITGLTKEKLEEQMKPSAENNIKSSLVLEAIQKQENIEASDEKVEEEFKKIAEQYKMKYEDLVKTVTDSQKESVKRELSIQATIDMLVAEANFVKAEKKAKKEETAENAEA